MLRSFLINMCRTASAACVLCVGGAATALNYDVNYTASSPTIDGSGADAAWGSASAAATGFAVYNNIAELSNQQTQVRLLWDSTYLYLLYEATDNSIVSSATSDDDVNFFAEQDIAEIYFDPSWAQSTAQNDKIYHIAIDPSASTYTFTEAGNGSLAWNLSSASTIAYAADGTNWNLEMAIAWTDLNSTEAFSPGVVYRAPYDGSVWGAQFGRTHSMVNSDNNTAFSKWNADVAGGFRTRPIGTLSFKGGPAATKVDLSNRTLNKAYGFEAPTYTNGLTVVGIEDWWIGATSNPDRWTATTTQKVTGDQALRISAASNSGQTLNNELVSTNTETSQYLQYALFLPREQIVGTNSNYRHVLYIRGLYGTGVNTLGRIWFRCSTNEGSNDVSVYSHENPTAQTEITRTEHVGLLAYDTWMWLTVKVDPVSKHFEIWLNDTQLQNPVSGNEKFTVQNKDTFTQLSHAQIYNKNYGIDPVYVDDINFYQDTNSNVKDWQLF